MIIKKTINYSPQESINKSWILHFDWIESDHLDFTNLQYTKVKKISALLENVNTIFDVGGNIGMYATFFRHFFPDAKIYGFEPLSNTYLIARENTKDDNVVWFNYGLWNEEATVTLNVPAGANQSTNYGAHWVNIEPGQSQDVRMNTLSNAIKEIGITPDFLKIDAEGGEYNILTGGAEYLKDIKYIMVEWRWSRRELPNPKNVHNLLSANGFKLLETIDKFDKVYINTNFGKERFNEQYQDAVGSYSTNENLHLNSIELANVLISNNVLTNTSKIFEMGAAGCRNLYYIYKLAELNNKSNLTFFANDLWKEASYRNMHEEIKNRVHFFQGDTEDIAKDITIPNLDLLLVSDHFMHLQHGKVDTILNCLINNWKPNYILLREIKEEFQTPEHPRLFHNYDILKNAYNLIFNGSSAQDDSYFIWLLKSN